MELIKEKMSDEFEKYHIHGLPFNAVIHHFTDVDKGGPHDHPFGFTSFILEGGYTERIYEIKPSGSFSIKHISRSKGTSHKVEATCIHEIVLLAPLGCWTLIIPGPKERESGFWRFNNNGIFFRKWFEVEFKLYKNDYSPRI